MSNLILQIIAGVLFVLCGVGIVVSIYRESRNSSGLVPDANDRILNGQHIASIRDYTILLLLMTSMIVEWIMPA